MPELPDIEGFRRALGRSLPGRVIRSVEVLDAGVLRNSTPETLAAALADQRFEQPRRQGKWLLLPTGGPILLVHSGMTGHPYYVGPAGTDGVPDRFDRLAVHLDHGQFRFSDLRKLRGIWLAHDPAEAAGIIGEIGPDALSVDEPEFAAALGRRGARLKVALTDQRTLAGLGNMLADEVCWQARIHPERVAAQLSDGELHRLYTTMRRVLRTAVRHARVPALRGWLSRIRDNPDAGCPRCGNPLRHGRVNGRMTIWCPQCQPADGRN